MAKWINHVAISTPRNGTTTHTVDPSTGTAVSGSVFTPTAGNLLVCAVQGGVTSTTPTGWTLPTGGSAVNATGCYVWWRTAAGGDTFSTTHNASNYAVAFDFYEFPAGSTFVKSVSAISVPNTSSAGPSITALTGTNLIVGQLGHGIASGNTAASVAWGSGVELIDYFLAFSTTDGIEYSMAYLEDSVLTSTTMSTTVTITGGIAGDNERLIYAVQVAAAVAVIPPILVMQTRRAY